MTATEKQNAIVGLGNVLRTVAAVLLMCDPRDLGIAIAGEVSSMVTSFEPDLFLFDKYPGGIGQSHPLFQLRARLLAGARDVLKACGCESGCPACVGPVGEVGDGGKQSALRLLEELTAS